MFIPICAQFHYAYGDSPYANFSGSCTFAYGDSPYAVCIRGSVSDVLRSFLESRIESEFSHALHDESEFCKCTHAHAMSKT